MSRLLPVAVALLAACSSAPTRSWEFGLFTVVQTTREGVARACWTPGVLGDDGKPVGRGDAECCFDRKRRVIYASTSSCLLHEMCHAFDVERCDEYQWSPPWKPRAGI